MTDLIDRAALRKVLGQHKREAALFGDEAKWEEMREAIAILDAAPTISCAECRWLDALRDMHNCERCYCGSNFERRQP